jgi:hypothetical protein
MPVASPPRRRRPSWDSWIRPSLTYARPSPVRVKSVIRPWCARVVSAALCFTSTICRLWLPPCEPPRTNATRTNTRRTPHRKRPNAERTTDEHRRARSTSDPLNSADRQSPVDSPFAARISSVSCPCAVRQESVLCPCAARVQSVRSLFAARVNPSRVRDMTFVSPCSGRQRACSHKGSRSLDEIHYAIWRIFTGGIASSSDFMGRKGLSLFRGPRSFRFGTILSLLM